MRKKGTRKRRRIGEKTKQSNNIRRKEKYEKKTSGGRNESANGLEAIRLVENDGKNNADKLGNAGKKQIGFDSASGDGLTGGDTERVFEDVNGTFDLNAVTVKVVPVIGITGNTGVKT